jgi:hypothetical protein
MGPELSQRTASGCICRSGRFVPANNYKNYDLCGKVEHEGNVETASGRHSLSTAQTAEPVPSPKSSGTNVLVVDDDNAVCRIVQRILSDQRYQVQTT